MASTTDNNNNNASSQLVDEETIMKLLPELKQKLEITDNNEDDEKIVGDASLCKYLYWKPNNMDRVIQRLQVFTEWRKEHPFAFDDTPLMCSKDANLKRVLESAVLIVPPNVTAKDGSSVVMGRLRFNDMSDGRTPEDVVRMMLYLMDRTLERPSTKQHGITVFHDMKDVTKNNIHLSVPKLLFGAIIGNLPLRIAGVYILNAPAFFHVLFKTVIRLFMPQKLRSRVHFIKDITEIHKVIDPSDLLEEHGGQLQHNQKEWVEHQMQREIDGTMESIHDCCYIPKFNKK